MNIASLSAPESWTAKPFYLTHGQFSLLMRGSHRHGRLLWLSSSQKSAMPQTTPSSLSSTPYQDNSLAAQVWTRSARRPSAAPMKGRKRWSRYERLSFSMLLSSWGILIVVVSWLFFSNSHLETRTSSTSGSHSSFYMGTSAQEADGSDTNETRSKGGQQ